MVVIYTAPGCLSCRKAKNYLKNHNIKYVEKNIFNVMLNNKEIKYLLKRSDFGSDDIISKRSKIIQDNKVDIDSMSVDELTNFVVENPSVLKRPIIIDDKNMQVGYDQEEIDAFHVNNLRKISKCDKECPNYEFCGSLKEDCK